MLAAPASQVNLCYLLQQCASATRILNDNCQARHIKSKYHFAKKVGAALLYHKVLVMFIAPRQSTITMAALLNIYTGSINKTS